MRNGGGSKGAPRDPRERESTNQVVMGRSQVQREQRKSISVSIISTTAKSGRIIPQRERNFDSNS